MGNRAVIVTEDRRVGMYLHWNGGRDSIRGFLKYCELQGFSPPEDDSYGWARLCQVVANYFSMEKEPVGQRGLSVGVDAPDKLDCDNRDNGVYVIRGWKIVGREHFDGREEQNNYELLEMLRAINKSQVEAYRLTDAQLEAATDEENGKCSSPESAASADAPSDSSPGSSAKGRRRKSAKPAAEPASA